MGICTGTLKSVADSQLDHGYSRAHLKSMFGLNRYPSAGLKIGTTAREFDRLATQYTDGASISGIQSKLLMNLEGNRLLPVATGGHYIVKPAPHNLANLPENEHAMMNLARALGFTVADCSLLPFEDGELGFVVKRFDILGNGQRLFVEDAASLCNVHPKNKGSDALSYENTLLTLFHASGNKMPVLLNGFRQVLLAYLIGNNDLHLKNFSMYREPDTRSTTMTDFTPIYDVLSVFPYPDYYGEYLSLSLLHSEVEGTFSKEYETYGYYSQHDFYQLGANLGLNQRASQTFVTRLVKSLELHLHHYVMSSFMPDKMKQLLLEQIQARIRCMSRPPVS